MRNQNVIWKFQNLDCPFVATAIHNGNMVSQQAAEMMALSESGRLREEDPFTGQMVDFAQNHIIVRTSRFEVDLNRTRDKAVYLTPEDAWGLKVWKEKPPQRIINHSLQVYDDFYAELQRLFTELKSRVNRFVVFDIHSYNHRRESPDGPAADAELNPEVNVGTGSMERARWASIVEAVLAELRAFDFLGRRLDVRENVKFSGGWFAKWIHQTFPESACALSIEFKKFWMDEWTGLPDQQQLEAIRRALQLAADCAIEELGKSGKS